MKQSPGSAWVFFTPPHIPQVGVNDIRTRNNWQLATCKSLLLSNQSSIVVATL